MKTYSVQQFKKYIIGFIDGFSQDPDQERILIEDDNKNIFSFESCESINETEKRYSLNQFKKYITGFIDGFLQNQDPEQERILIEDNQGNIFSFGPYNPDDDRGPHIIVYSDGTKLISVVSDKQAEIGQPDCVLNNPYVISASGDLTPWLGEYTKRKVFIVHSEKFLTVTKPTKEYIKKYKTLVDATEE